MQFRPIPGDRNAALLVLAHDPAIIEAARLAAARLPSGPPRLVGSGLEALRHLFSTGETARQLVCEPSAAGEIWPALRATANDPFGPAGIVVVGQGDDGFLRRLGGSSLPEALTAALRKAAGLHPRGPEAGPEELAIGLARGEITVRYQPVVSIADRRPVLLEGLARWHRRNDAPVGPDHFVPLAERSGQAQALAMAVSAAAFSELSAAPARIGAALSLNLPLAVLLERDVLGWMRRLMRHANFPLSALTLELTETTPVRDRPALRRALWRLQRAGLPVLIDDMGLEEDRAALLELPFAGIKLDRHLVAAMPHRRRARTEVERLTELAHSRRMSVTAEGISNALLWRAVAAAGVDNAQGYAVSRPLPAAALSAWGMAWRGGLHRQRERE
ncbi:EAL domain-containing protein [Roseomonas sp. M0104]|uniref:EAL domain-containing protein n=1 Tax=Teichococcus coralli TaxID=2545983 RepID=A0A845B7Y7_9PROT|nr:EAL domain-containing protein [Pseudoroseomonas coralli]MXP62184.1 EAL domain-containing protein [Pseudoroseomonas coralli]